MMIVGLSCVYPATTEFNITFHGGVVLYSAGVSSQMLGTSRGLTSKKNYINIRWEFSRCESNTLFDDSQAYRFTMLSDDGLYYLFWCDLRWVAYGRCARSYPRLCESVWKSILFS